MGEKFKLGDKEYDSDHLSETAKLTFAYLQFTNARIMELRNMSALLQRAKNSYIDSLKKEVLAEKSGFLLDD